MNRLVSLWGGRKRRRKAAAQKLLQITTALDIPMPRLFSGEPGRAVDENGDRLERLIAFLRGLDAGDLEVFNEILPRLVEWKGGK